MPPDQPGVQRAERRGHDYGKVMVEKGRTVQARIFFKALTGLSRLRLLR